MQGTGRATVVRSFTSPFMGSRGAPTYRKDVSYAALREILTGFSTLEGQRLVPNTESVYKSTAKSQKWKENTVDFGNGAKGHWLGHHDAKFVLIYFHG